MELSSRMYNNNRNNNNSNNNNSGMMSGDGSGNNSSQIHVLGVALFKLRSSNREAVKCCEQLSKRAHHLDSLTSPASGASSTLSRANNNLTSSLVLMKDAREKFDTVSDCEPAIKRLHDGVAEMESNSFTATGGIIRSAKGGNRGSNNILLTEQDVYAAGDSLEILRDAFDYFDQRRHYRSVPDTILNLEDVYSMGVGSMCKLITLYLMKAGQAVRPKGTGLKSQNNETAVQTRQRLSMALQNRDLMKSIGDYEDFLPVETRNVREIRAIFECLGCHGYSLAPPVEEEPDGLKAVFGVPPNKVLRTEKVGSGCYSSLTKEPLRTGFPQLDAYGEARKNAAFSSIDSYYRRMRQDRKKRNDKHHYNNDADSTTTFEHGMVGDNDDADAAARDACRCLEHAMIVVAGEKNVYRAVVAPFAMKPQHDPNHEEEDDDNNESTAITPYLRKACVAAYSHAVAAVVDRGLDIIETVFLKEGGIGQSSGALKSTNSTVDAASNAGDGTPNLTVQRAANAAAAGLRLLDGVRMLGPSLAKLCEMSIPGADDSKTNPATTTSIASILCIAIHRTTVKNTARTLENLAKAIQDDPVKGKLNRPHDASVSSVTKDTVLAIRLMSPFVSAYKSVSKRRALLWDPNMGEEAGELDSFVRFLIMRLLNSLKGKALHYVRDGGGVDSNEVCEAKSHLFLVNNYHYLLEHLGTGTYNKSSQQNQKRPDAEHYRIEGSWFVDKVSKLLESEKAKYVSLWEVLNNHITTVGKDEMESGTKLSTEAGRIVKQKFTAFNEDFERMYGDHKKLCVINTELKEQLQNQVRYVFLARYERFYNNYANKRFSKKHQSQYMRFDPKTIGKTMIPDLFVVTATS